MDERTTWRVVGAVSGLAVGAITRLLITRTWQRVQREDPPGNPATDGTSWSSALVWAVSSGAALAIGRLVAQRGAAEVWKTATGSYPPGLEDTRP